MESLDELRQRRFTEAQKLGWVYEDTTSQVGEGYGRKAVMQLAHPDTERPYLFIGPRGGMKTGRSYRSSACCFWEDTPTPGDVTAKHSSS